MSAQDTLRIQTYQRRLDAIGAHPLREVLARRTNTNPEDWYVVFKARQGMKAAFDALAETQIAGEGRDEVITQLFTCCTAVVPIMAAGLVPVYGDISAQTLAVDVDALPLSKQTAAVMLQHTFGTIDEGADARLVEAAHAAGAIVVEDCAHCAGRVSAGQDGLPLVDVSVHSFGVEKMLPSHFGGAIWVNPRMSDAQLRTRIVTKLQELPELDDARATAARHYLNQIRVLTRLPRGAAHVLRSYLETHGKFEPAVAETELEGAFAGEAALPSAWVVSRVLEAFENASVSEQHRKEIVALYNEEFAGFKSVSERAQHDASQPLLKYFVCAPDAAKADAALAALSAAGIYTVAWYRPLLFPGVTNEAAYGLDAGLEHALANLPVTAELSRGAICLPTDITLESARKAAEIVKGYL